MSLKSISEAYSQFGSEGLTEKGKNVRLGCIVSATAGTTLVITGIVLFILLELSCTHAGLFPTTASVLGGCFGTSACLAVGSSLIIAAHVILNEKAEYIDEYIETEPPIKYGKARPDPRNTDL